MPPQPTPSPTAPIPELASGDQRPCSKEKQGLDVKAEEAAEKEGGDAEGEEGRIRRKEGEEGSKREEGEEQKKAKKEAE